jgi:hypothetical protein
LYDGPVIVSKVVARSWPTGTAPISLRSSNGFQMAAGTSVQGFTAERSAYRFVIQVG